MKQWIAGLAVAGFSTQCGATSIIALIARDGIVICADGKVSEGFADRTPTSGSSNLPSPKIRIIDRFVVSHSGISEIGYGPHGIAAYSTESIFTELKRAVPSRASVKDASEIIKKLLVRRFAGFDALLKSGQLRRDILPPPAEIFTDFAVAGYDGANPVMYETRVEIDWVAKTHRVTGPIPLYPDRRRNLSILPVGSKIILLSLGNPRNAVYQQFQREMPTEHAAMLHDRVLNVEQMVNLARRIVGMEAGVNPREVGYPLTIITVLPGNKPTSSTYNRHR